MIDEATFRRESDRALEQLKQALIRAEDAADDPQFEAEEKNGVLNVLFEDGSSKFVFTPNTPVAQIWISAQSTSYKLHWDDAHSAFALPATGEALLPLTERLLREHLQDASLTLS
jgi:CyaY protein